MKYETERKPNFYGDIESFGKFGEEDFEKFIIPICKKKGYSLLDVRQITEYQRSDIDYIIDKQNGKDIPSLQETVNNTERYVKIEVKCNTIALTTGYYAYETVSHGKDGWCIVTKSDWIYNALCKKNTCELQKRCWINMAKWRDYVNDNSTAPKKINKIVNENIVDILCNMDDMEKRGILKYI